MNATPKQKEMMLQWMKLHPEVARGRLCRKDESRKEMKQLLEDLAGTINAANVGPVKSSSEWLKTWKDWKIYVLKKETKRRNHGLGTGGGSPIKIPFSSLEEELLYFITPEAAGLENIPQGGIDLYENVETDPNDMQTMQNLHFEENKLPYKKLCNNDKFLKTKTGLKMQLSSPEAIHIQEETRKSNTQSLSNEMVNIQKEKLVIKKEEVQIQQQLLEVHQSILVELQQIRKTVDTFGHVE
ncbi:unnamed protein product [Lasius platythorax]|uniref:Regulatory protein zeste n=1 Tax=Lasius platythorax TaxID=488582 RepID=A0AAV2N046_9HYME